MLLIHSHLNLADPNSAILWAAFSTAWFGFLRISEFTFQPSGFDPSVHLSISDLAMDYHHRTSGMLLLIKASKTDPFHQGVRLFLPRTGGALPSCQPLSLTCIAVVIRPVRCSSLQTGNPSPAFTSQPASAISSRRPVSKATSQAIVFGLALPLPRTPQGFPTP